MVIPGRQNQVANGNYVEGNNGKLDRGTGENKPKKTLITVIHPIDSKAGKRKQHEEGMERRMLPANH